MPKLSYLGSVLPVPKDIQLKIDKRLLKFIVPHGKTFLTVNNLSAGWSHGGIGLVNINLHCKIMLLRNVMYYLKHRVNLIMLSPAQQYVEYNLGHQLSLLWGLPFNNSALHASKPNSFYEYIFEFLKDLKNNGITLEDLMECKVNVI